MSTSICFFVALACASAIYFGWSILPQVITVLLGAVAVAMMLHVVQMYKKEYERREREAFGRLCRNLIDRGCV